jgi:DNA gyrase subunit A
MAAYKLGRGSITVRGRVDIEEIRKDRYAIICTELPFMVNKARWITATASLVREKKLQGIADIRDESDRNGMRVVFELKRDANEHVVLSSLYKMTALQSTFAANMLAIVDGRPTTLTLRDALQVFIQHRRDVVTRRSLHDLRQARARREIVEGLGLAIMQVDRVIEIIRSSKDTDEAKARLIAEKMMGLEGFLERAGRPADEVDAAREAGFVYLSERQAQAILDMRLGRLTGLEREKLEAEYRDLWELTDYLEGLLADDAKLMACIVEELTEIRDKYGDDRRTEIAEQDGEILDEDLYEVEDVVITRTHLDYIKRTPAAEYSAQGRGGRGVKGAESADDDFVADMFAASTHDHILVFTTKGRVYQKKVFELPSGSRISRGRPIVNVIDLQEDEKVVAILPVAEFHDDHTVFFATKSGTVKKTGASAYAKIRSTGIIAISIEEGDDLVDVQMTHAGMDVVLATKNGQLIRFNDDQVRPMGRDARGVRGIKLRGDDQVVGMTAFEPDSTATLLTVCENGYGKRTALEEYPTKNRAGMGVINIKTTKRNGPVAGIKLLADEDHIMLISDHGKLIRMRAEDISTQGRGTQGVRLMRLADDETVVSVERLAEADTDEDEDGPEGGEPGDGGDDAESGDSSATAESQDSAESGSDAPDGEEEA